MKRERPENKRPDNKAPETRDREEKTLIFCIGGAVLLLAGGAAAVLLTRNGEDETVYREETVQYGELTVGLQETGSVEVGTTEQIFELDMSAYTESGDSSFSWEQGGGNRFSGDDGGRLRLILVEKPDGGGDSHHGGAGGIGGRSPLPDSQDSIDEIRNGLSADVSDAQVTLEQTQTQLAMTQLEAQQEYDTDTAYDSVLAQAEYDSTIKELQEAVTEIEEQIAEANEELLDWNEKLLEYQTDLETEKKILENAEYVLETTELITDAYGWITAENAREDAESVIETWRKKLRPHRIPSWRPRRRSKI